MHTGRYQHIIWDWNGTLLDDVGLSIDVMNELLARRHRSGLDRDRYHAIFDFPVRAYYERAGFDLSPPGAFEQLGSEWMEAYERRRFDCPLQPGVPGMLTAMAATGATQSILSAYPQRRLEEVVGHFGLTHHFVRLLGLDDIYAHSKLELGRRWVEELAVPAGSIVLIGDTLHDLDVAEALGIDCVLVAQGHHPASRLRERARRVVENLASLGPVLGLSTASG
jgi:phosphoglycolate phosphatase